MQFASPTSLLWLLLALPIVVLYILKVRWRRAPVSTVMFWNQMFAEKRPRSIWQRLRHLISLLLQLAFLVLLALAVADPFFAGDKLQPRRIVVVVDNSASMSAKIGPLTRLDLAKQRGERLIRGLRMRDQLAIVSAGTVPKLATGLTGHQRTLRAALQAIAPTDGPTQVKQSVDLGRRLLAGQDHAEILVLSDGCFAGAGELADSAANDRVQLDLIGKPLDNVAITQFQVRRSFIDVVGYQILVELTNYATVPIECRLEISLGVDLVDVIPLKLEPNQPYRQVLDHTSEAGGHLMAKIDARDALLVDNVAVVILPERKRQPVLLVTDGNLFLQSALSAIPLVDVRTVRELPETIADDAIVIFDGSTPTAIPAGNVFVVQPKNSTQFWKLGEAISEPIVTDQDNDSSLLTHVQLENVVLPDARTLDFNHEHHVLASSIGGQPLYVSIEHARGKTLVITVDLRKGDLPLRTSFPIMMTNAINWFRGEGAELQQALATGDIVDCWLSSGAIVNMSPAIDELGSDGASVSSTVVNAVGKEVADTSSQLVLRSPDGHDDPLPAGVERLTLGPLAQCGVWQVVRKDPKANRSAAKPNETVVAEYACNLSNREESNLRSAADLQVPRAIYAGALGGRPIWFYLIVGGFLLTTVEWYLYQRRWIS